MTTTKTASTDMELRSEYLPSQGGDDMREEWEALATEYDDGSAAFTQHFGLDFPRLKTDFGKNGRGFIDSLTAEVFPEIEVVILNMPPSRQWWEKGIDETGGGNRPDCWSTDLIANKPDGDVPTDTRQSDRCRGKCPMAEWSTGPNGERIAPPCGEAINVFLYHIDTATYYWTRFQSTAIPEFRRYISTLARRRQMPFGVVTRISLSEPKRRGAQEWHVPVFETIRDLVPSDPTLHLIRGTGSKAMQSWVSTAEDLARADAIDAKAGEPFETAATEKTYDADGMEF